MLSEKMQKEINEQISRELTSEYIYLSMAMYASSQSLDGFANWFTVQAQ